MHPQQPPYPQGPPPRPKNWVEFGPAGQHVAGRPMPRHAVVVPPRKQNVAGHVLATVLTGGLWLPVWFTIRLFARRKPKVQYR